MILSRSAGPTRLLISPSTIKKTVATNTPQFERLAELYFTTAAVSQRTDGCESGASSRILPRRI